MSHQFAGVIPPILTPLHEDGSFDRESFARLVERLIDGGVHGIFVLGSSGEVAYLDDDVRRQVLEAAVEIIAGRVPVMAGVIDISTNRVLKQIEMAQEAGVDALVATAPMYIRTDEREIESHFRILGEAAQLPLFAYDLPVCVHVKLEVGMLVRLGQDGVLAGVKDSSGDDVGFRRLVAANRAAGSPLALFTGHEAVVDGMLLLGADGLVPGLGNVDPAGYVKLWDLAQDRKWEEVREEQDRLAALFEIVFQATDLSGGAAGLGAFKTALQLLDVLNCNRMTVPAARYEGVNVDKVAQIVKAAGLPLP